MKMAELRFQSRKSDSLIQTLNQKLYGEPDLGSKLTRYLLLSSLGQVTAPL